MDYAEPSRIGKLNLVEFKRFFTKKFVKAYLSKSWRFVLVGASGSLLSLVILYLAVQYGGLYYITADILAIAISAIWNFNLNIIVKVIKIE